MYPTEYRYTSEHEWIKVSGDPGTIGITDYAQHELGDVVFVELPAKGSRVEAWVRYLPMGHHFWNAIRDATGAVVAAVNVSTLTARGNLGDMLAELLPKVLAAAARMSAALGDAARQNLAVFERAAERARYEAGRALRQYDNIEPENRLVARTPEAVLEDKLAAVRTADSQLTAQRARRPVTLTDQETAWITTAGADLRAIFDAPTTTHTQRKELIRAVITEIVITPGKPADAAGSTDSGRTCQIRIIWQGGASTDVQMSPPASGKHGRTTSEDTIDLIRRLAPRYNDTTIAQILGQQNRRTASGLPFRKAHVRALRAYHGIPGYQPPPGNVTPGCQDAAVVGNGRWQHRHRALGRPHHPHQRHDARLHRGSPGLADRDPAARLRPRPQRRRGRLGEHEERPGQPRRRRREPAHRDHQEPAQKHPVPARPHRRLPRPNRAQPRTRTAVDLSLSTSVTSKSHYCLFGLRWRLLVRGTNLGNVVPPAKPLF